MFIVIIMKILKILIVMLILTIVYDDVLRLNVKIQKHDFLKLTSATVKILVSSFKKKENLFLIIFIYLN